MRFVVFGAGAVGGVVGGRLFQHGHDVTLIARGAHLDAIRGGGLRLQSPDDEVRLDVPAVARASDVDWRDDDVCLLAVKSQDTETVLDALGAAAPASVRIACLQNGVDNERRALRHFEHVYGVCVMLPSTYLEPGVVQASSSPITGALNIGRYPTGVDDTAIEIAEAFAASTLLSDPDEHVMAQKYAKLVMNLGNAVEALTGRIRSRSEVLRQARSEAEDVFAAAGIDVAPRGHDAEQRQQIDIRPIDGAERGGGSTWQSLARGAASVETDHLNGEIVLLGRLHGVPTPVNALLQRLVADAARDGTPPASMTIEDLEAQLLS